MVNKIVLLVIILLYASSILLPQDKKELEKTYSKRIIILTDSTLNYNRLYSDSIYKDFCALNDSLIYDYKDFFDSLNASVKNSLNKSSLDSISGFYKILLKSYNNYFDSLKNNFNLFYFSFVNQVTLVNGDYITCIDCKGKEDFIETEEEYLNNLDSLSKIYQDTLLYLNDTLSVMLEDKIENHINSIIDYSDSFLEEKDEDEYELIPVTKTSVNRTIDSNEKENKIMLEFLLQSHSNYRTRDNGYEQKSFNPVLTYEHSSGFGTLLSLNFPSDSPKLLDETDIGFYYTFQPLDFLTGSVMYTRMFFDDSSKAANSSLKNSLEGAFSLDFKWINFTTSLMYDFSGSDGEVTLLLGSAVPLTISKNILNGKLSFEPGINAYFGEQNANLILLRKGKGNTVIPKLSKKNVYGVLGYEFDFPLNLELKNITLRPDITIIYPLNVIDQSSKNLFLNLSLDFTVWWEF